MQNDQTQAFGVLSARYHPQISENKSADASASSQREEKTIAGENRDRRLETLGRNPA